MKGGKQEMEPRESEVKECSLVLEMRDGAKRGGIRAEGSGYCGSNSLETSQLDRYPGNQQADSAPHARIQGWGGQRERGGREAGGGEGGQCRQGVVPASLHASTDVTPLSGHGDVISASSWKGDI